jgi:hypothetical protein
VRLTAVSYFSDSFTQDATIMPLVVQAVEKYGRDTAFRILRDAERLPQTEQTAEWLINELQTDYDFEDLDQDNYRFAVAIALYEADARLLQSRQADILALPAFPEQLCEPLNQRIDMLSWDWDRGWEALEHFAIDTMCRQKFTQNDLRYADRLIKSFARHRVTKADTVLRLLKRPYEGKDRSIVLWLEPQIVALAGEMRLGEAIPLLVNRLGRDEDWIIDDAFTALEKIGGDAVVQAIDGEWWDADPDFRCSLACVLEHIHTDLCAERCLRYFMAEEDLETQIVIANTVLGLFIEEAIDPVWAIFVDVDEEDLSPDERDLQYRLVAVATIMEKSFPTYEEWYKDALRDNWGWFDREHKRLADAFRPDQVGPERGGNGKGY